MTTETLERVRNELCVLNRAGDIKTIWDPDVASEVDEARRQFNELKSKRFTIFRVNRTGGKGEVMHEFDPSAEKLIAVPAVVGG